MGKISELVPKKNYEPNSELILALHIIPALNYVPESKVGTCIRIINSRIMQFENQTEYTTNNLEKLENENEFFQKKLTLKGI